MNRLTRQLGSYWIQFRSVVRNEFRTIFTDGGVMLILIFAILIYATAYSRWPTARRCCATSRSA